jgi:ech hydrogenase subunit D
MMKGVVIIMGQQTIKEITSKDLLAETLRLKNDGYRLVAISCTNLKTKQVDPPEEKVIMQLSYSFDKDYDLLSLRFENDTVEEVESISVIFPFAFLYENEIKELFGVKIKDIAIDLNDTLYKIPVKTPFNMKKEDE